jgi:hypothetical protein
MVHLANNMKKYKSILAFGDSHPAGCESSRSKFTINDYINGHVDLEDLDLSTKPFSFPNLLADILDVPCYNYSLSGGSNKRSLRLLPQALLEHSDSLVLFNYTETHRSEIYYPEFGRHLGQTNDGYIQLGIQWYTVKNSKFNHPINDYFVENMLHIDSTNLDIFNTMFYVDQSCKNLALDYFHIFGFPNLYSGSNLVDQSKILNLDLDTNAGYGDFISWCNLQGFTKLPYGHYDLGAHILFSKLLYNKLN